MYLYIELFKRKKYSLQNVYTIKITKNINKTKLGEFFTRTVGQ